MPLMSRSIPALFNGVSQQSPTARLVSQCDEQINFLGTVVDGLVKRPPLISWLSLWEGDWGSCFVHSFVVNDAEEYLLIIKSGGGIRLYNLVTGLVAAVNLGPGAGAYLNTTNPRDDLIAVSIGDQTVIVNKTVTVQMAPDRTAGAITGKVQTFGELPATPTEGSLYEIVGDPSNGFDNYYVWFGGGVWRETLSPLGLSYKLDNATMPHVLTRNAPGSFTFDKVVWDDRLVGDDNSNPIPSFVGRKINHAFMHKSRLGLLAGEHAILSEVTEIGNYWLTTVTDLLDSDPIDVVSDSDGAPLQHGISFDEGLILFSRKKQFALTSGDQPLSARTAAIDPTTAFEYSPKAVPIGVGSSLFFATPAGNFSAIREYFVESDTLTKDAADIAAHVPRYIPKNVIRIAGSSNYDTLLVLSSDTPNVLYVYHYYWKNAEELVQSAWCKWVFDAGDIIRGVEIIDNIVYLPIQRSDGMHIDYIDLQNGATADDAIFQVYLDRRRYLTGIYDGLTDTTTWTLPSPEALDAPLRIVLGPDFAGRVGALLAPSSYIRPDTTHIQAPGDYSAGEAWIGHNYEARYKFSQIFPRDQRDDTILRGRLALRYMTLFYMNTGFFSVVVTPRGREGIELGVSPAMQSAFTGKTIGETALLGSPQFRTGEFRFPIFANAENVEIELVNDSYLASNFQKAEWEGFYTSRSSGA